MQADSVQQQRRRNATPVPTFGRKASSRAGLSKDAEWTRTAQLYYLASDARDKLFAQVKREDHDLRIMVGHANLLDVLITELNFDNEQQEQDWLSQTLANTKTPPIRPTPIRYNDAASIKPAESSPVSVVVSECPSNGDSASDCVGCLISDSDDSSSSSGSSEDEDDDDDYYDYEKELADRVVYFHNLIPSPPDTKELALDDEAQQHYLHDETTITLPLTVGDKDATDDEIRGRSLTLFAEREQGNELRGVQTVDFARSSTHKYGARSGKQAGPPKRTR